MLIAAVNTWNVHVYTYETTAPWRDVCTFVRPFVKREQKWKASRKCLQKSTKNFTKINYNCTFCCTLLMVCLLLFFRYQPANYPMQYAQGQGQGYVPNAQQHAYWMQQMYAQQMAQYMQ